MSDEDDGDVATPLHEPAQERSYHRESVVFRVGARNAAATSQHHFFLHLQHTITPPNHFEATDHA
jgi:hypothetical protein